MLQNLAVLAVREQPNRKACNQRYWPGEWRGRAVDRGHCRLDMRRPRSGLEVAQLPAMPRFFVAGFLVVALQWLLTLTARAPTGPATPTALPMRVSHVTTTNVSARQFTLDTILGQPAHTWTRRLDDGVELDGAVFEIADAATDLHHIYVVHVVPRAEF